MDTIGSEVPLELPLNGSLRFVQRKLSHLQRASLRIQAETLDLGATRGLSHPDLLKLAALKDHTESQVAKMSDQKLSRAQRVKLAKQRMKQVKKEHDEIRNLTCSIQEKVFSFLVGRL